MCGGGGNEGVSVWGGGNEGVSVWGGGNEGVSVWRRRECVEEGMKG